MGQSPEELKQEIESTRSDLGETLDAIGDRVSPGRVIERRTNRVRLAVGGLRDRVMGFVDDTTSSANDRIGSTVDTIREAPSAGRATTQGHPMVAGALAFGVGFLIAAVVPRTQAEEQAATQLADRVEPLKQELSEAGHEVAQSLSDPAREAAHELKDTAKAGVQEVASQVQGATASTKEAARDAAELRH
jgi:ElaB/YqjD/DUF883 family membrane-anchored ribosome-binding protein